MSCSVTSGVKQAIAAMLLGLSAATVVVSHGTLPPIYCLWTFVRHRFAKVFIGLNQQLPPANAQVQWSTHGHRFCWCEAYDPALPHMTAEAGTNIWTD